MHTSSVALLLIAAGAVGFLHSILPDHWVPLAVIGRTQRWSLVRVARVSALAAAGHVLPSLVLGAVIAIVGLRFQHQIDVQQGHIVGGVLVLTGLGFLIWGLTGHGHHDHTHGLAGAGEYAAQDIQDIRDIRDVRSGAQGEPSELKTTSTATLGDASKPQSILARRLVAIAVPFGVAASPDLTILPVALAASAVGVGAIAGTLVAFAAVTLATFIGLTVFATLAGYQIKGEWLEDHATTITALVLVAIGIVAYVGL
ncbi:MAG TPA: hypothetical protein VF120_01100 [Ktedonobacterales bacterium]